jgi:16S rRNA (guanine966-N2)-methyltransferase
MTAKSGEGNRPRAGKRRESGPSHAAKSSEGSNPTPAKSHREGRPGYVRIIGGIWRGRRLSIPQDAVLRPTPDRVRETLFNWLAPDIEGAVCVDLFAGTGSLGFEALSRGAAEAWLVEREAKLVRALAKHAAALGGAGAAASCAGAAAADRARAHARTPAAARAPARARIEQGSALEFLRRSSEPRFDIAFVDPPFADPIEPVLAALGPRLRRRALVYVERPAEAGLPDAGPGHWIKSSRAGAVVYGLLRFDGEHQAPLQCRRP